MIDHGVRARDQTEGQCGGEGEHSEEKHLKCGHTETGRIVTDKFQKDMIAPFIESGA
jgi:hypothetical protein